MAISFLRTPHADAAAFLRGKAVVGHDTFKRLIPDVRAKATSIVGVNSIRATAEIIDTVATIPEGASWEETKEKIAEQLRPWLAPQTIAADVDESNIDEIDKAERMLYRRAENMLRINCGQAYSAAKSQTLDDNDDIFPYRQYLTMGDGRVRASHAALNHLILPANHPFWDKHTPPWEFGCRCDFAGVSAEEAGEIKHAEKARGIPREQRTVLDDDLQQQVAQGRLMRGNGFVDLRTQHQKTGDGYEWNPRSLRWPRARVLDSIDDAALRAKWEAWAKATTIPDRGGMTVWQWMA